MTSIVIPYGTTEGQTAKIAAYIADVIGEHGYEARAVDVKGADTLALESYDAVIIGASIHMGKHDKHVRDFVAAHRDVLERLPAAFFSVSLAAYDNRAEAEGYIEEFVRETGWHPGKVGLFGGALLYRQYGFIKRHLMKRIVHDKGNPDTDTSRDYVYTEWESVKHFVEEFLALLPTPVAR